MTDNKNLKNAIRAAKEVSGLSYVEQRKGTLLELAGYDENSIPSTISGLMADFHDHYCEAVLNASQFDEFIAKTGLNALFEGSAKQIEVHGSWNNFMNLYGEKAFDGLCHNDCDSDVDTVYSYYNEKFWGSRDQFGMTEELYQAVFTAGELLASEHGQKAPDGLILTNDQSVKLLGSVLAARWAEFTNVTVDTLVLGWGELNWLLKSNTYRQSEI